MPAQPAEIFRRNVRRIMDDRGLTQDELALLAGTKGPNISRILSGKEHVTIDRAGRIAKALKTPLFELLMPLRILQEIA